MKKLLFSILLASLSAQSHAEEYIEWVGANSGVNWSAGQIQAEGAGVGPDNVPPSMARMMACRAAVLDAQRNLLESIQGVRVEGTTIVANMMIESDIIKTTVSGLLQGAQVINREPQSDGSCTVTMIAPLGGKFTTAVYNEVFKGETQQNSQVIFTPLDAVAAFIDSGLEILIPRSYAAETMPWQDSIDRLSQRISALEDLLSTHPAVVEASSSGPTGLVIDARGSNFIPSMSPKIRQIRAGVIYPAPRHQISRRERGQLVSLFTRDLNTAQRHPRVGDRPIVLKALRTFGSTRTEIVLGTKSSDRLISLVKAGFLDDSGVIIVL
ncbi:MAG: hypothetical protein VB957_18050 [Pseudomonadales bacterium]|jgi:hypothetical protein